MSAWNQVLVALFTSQTNIFRLKDFFHPLLLPRTSSLFHIHFHLSCTCRCSLIFTPAGGKFCDALTCSWLRSLGNPFKMHRDWDRLLQLLIFNEKFLVSVSHQCMRIRPGIGPCKSAPGGCMFKERLVKMVVAKPPAWFHWSSRLRFLNSLPLGLWEKETDHGAAWLLFEVLHDYYLMYESLEDWRCSLLASCWAFFCLHSWSYDLAAVFPSAVAISSMIESTL